MNPYADKRRAELLQLLDPQQTTEEVVRALSDFVESEVKSAYRRGIRDGQHPRVQERSQGDRRPGEFRSAVAAGVLRPVHREGA